MRAEASRDDGGRAEPMIENHQASVEADAAIRDLEVVHRMAGQPGLDEPLQVVAPETEDAAQGEGEVDLVEDLAALGKGSEDGPGIAELDLPPAVVEPCLAPGSHRLEGQERPRRDDRVPGRGHLEHPGPEYDPPGLPVQQRPQRFRGVGRLDGLDKGSHAAMGRRSLFTVGLFQRWQGSRCRARLGTR